MYDLTSFVFLITLIAFVVFWWKKRKARIVAGAEYANDKNYQKVSKTKRLIGWVCIASLLISLALQPERTTEEKATMTQQQEVKKQQRQEDDVRKAFNKSLKEYKSTMSKHGDIFDWNFLGIEAIEFVAPNKAIVRWTEQYKLRSKNGKVTVQKHPGTTYMRNFHGSWEVVLDDWKKL